MSSPNSRTEYTYEYGEWVFPTLLFALEAHDNIFEGNGGESLLVNEGALISALSAPTDGFEEHEAYPTFTLKVAALGFRVAKNHVFADGNKRTALMLMSHTLEWQGIELNWAKEVEVMVMSLLGAGHLDLRGLEHALNLACGLIEGSEYE